MTKALGLQPLFSAVFFQMWREVKRRGKTIKRLAPPAANRCRICRSDPPYAQLWPRTRDPPISPARSPGCRSTLPGPQRWPVPLYPPFRCVLDYRFGHLTKGSVTGDFDVCTNVPEPAGYPPSMPPRARKSAAAGRLIGYARVSTEDQAPIRKPTNASSSAR